MSDKNEKKPEVKDLSPKKDAKGGRAVSQSGVQQSGVQQSGVQQSGIGAQGISQNRAGGAANKASDA